MGSTGGGEGRSAGIGMVGSIGGGSSGPIGGTFLGSGTRGGSCIIGRCQLVIVSSHTRSRSENPPSVNGRPQPVCSIHRDTDQTGSGLAAELTG
jgi:hypothetical protein